MPQTVKMIILLFVTVTLASCRQAPASNDYLLVFTDTTNDGHGYKNLNGDLVIPVGKYIFCFTDTFKTYAIVLKPDSGF